MTDNELTAVSTSIDITPTKRTNSNQDEKELTRTTTRTSSVQKKMTDLLDNPIFSGFLLIVAGFCIAFQAGKQV